MAKDTETKSVARKAPTRLTDTLIENVLERLSQGTPLTHAAREFGFHPSAWHQMVQRNETVAIACARAREEGADHIAEDIMRIIDEAPLSSEAIQKAKMQAEYRLKLLAKWHPKKYGDKQQFAHTGEDGGPIVVQNADALDRALDMAKQAARTKPVNV